jgi:hypothetical protein
MRYSSCYRTGRSRSTRNRFILAELVKQQQQQQRWRLDSSLAAAILSRTENLTHDRHALLNAMQRCESKVVLVGVALRRRPSHVLDARVGAAAPRVVRVGVTLLLLRVGGVLLM